MNVQPGGALPLSAAGLGAQIRCLAEHDFMSAREDVFFLF